MTADCWPAAQMVGMVSTVMEVCSLQGCTKIASYGFPSEVRKCHHFIQQCYHTAVATSVSERLSKLGKASLSVGPRLRHCRSPWKSCPRTPTPSPVVVYYLQGLRTKNSVFFFSLLLVKKSMVVRGSEDFLQLESGTAAFRARFGFRLGLGVGLGLRPCLHPPRMCFSACNNERPDPLEYFFYTAVSSPPKVRT